MGPNCNMAVKNCHLAQEKGRDEWYHVQGEGTYQCFDIKRYMTKTKAILWEEDTTHSLDREEGATLTVAGLGR